MGVPGKREGAGRGGEGGVLQPAPHLPPLQLCGKAPGVDGDGSLDPPTHPEEGSGKVRGSHNSGGCAGRG